jgi:anti-sigma factor RsiW
MASNDRHDRLLAAFLGGELDLAEARRWDEHLLECEQCWQAVREDRAGRQAAQALRQPVPPGLADRVAFAVEMSAEARPASRQSRPPGRSRRPGSHGRRLRWRLATAGLLAAGLAATIVVTLLAGRDQVGRVSAAVAAVARYAQMIKAPAGGRINLSGGRAAAVELGRPVTVTAGGQRIELRTWRLGGAEAVVAVSNHPFPAPARARNIAGQGMAWSARLGSVGLYCVNGRTSELVAAPVRASELRVLAARLPLR